MSQQRWHILLCYFKTLSVGLADQCFIELLNWAAVRRQKVAKNSIAVCESNMTINFQDWCGAASLYYNYNHTEITFLLCEQTPYLLWFLCWQRVHVHLE